MTTRTATSRPTPLSNIKAKGWSMLSPNSGRTLAASRWTSSISVALTSIGMRATIGASSSRISSKNQSVSRSARSSVNTTSWLEPAASGSRISMLSDRLRRNGSNRATSAPPTKTRTPPLVVRRKAASVALGVSRRVAAQRERWVGRYQNSEKSMRVPASGRRRWLTGQRSSNGTSRPIMVERNAVRQGRSPTPTKPLTNR